MSGLENLYVAGCVLFVLLMMAFVLIWFSPDSARTAAAWLLQRAWALDMARNEYRRVQRLAKVHMTPKILKDNSEASDGLRRRNEQA